MNLEEYLGEEFELLRVTPHITHLKLTQESYYSVITVASRHHIAYLDQVKWLGMVFAEARAEKRSDLGTFILDAYAKGGFGVSLCHHLDSFDRKRGRVIAKGRLLKLLWKERLEYHEVCVRRRQASYKGRQGQSIRFSVKCRGLIEMKETTIDELKGDMETLLSMAIEVKKNNTDEFMIYFKERISGLVSKYFEGAE